MPHEVKLPKVPPKPAYSAENTKRYLVTFEDKQATLSEVLTTDELERLCIRRRIYVKDIYELE